MEYSGEGHHHHHHHHHGGGEGYQGEYAQQGGFQQGGYDQGGFQQGGYDQGGFQQGGFQQGGYTQPGQGYQQPGMGGQYGGQRREFFIVSEMNGKVVDIENGNTSEGTKLCTWDKHQTPKKNQLWYMDYQGFIRSALNDMTFTNQERGQHVKTSMAQMGDPRSQWRLDGNRIINQVGDVLDISGRHNRDGAELISYQDDQGSNQHWRLEYIN